MKLLMSALAFLTVVTAYAGPEDRVETLLACNAGVYGIKSLNIIEDRSGFKELEITFENDNTEKRAISNREIEDLQYADLYIAQDGELNITFSKVKMDQNIFDYYLNRKGDGYNESYLISCID